MTEEGPLRAASIDEGVKAHGNPAVPNCEPPWQPETTAADETMLTMAVGPASNDHSGTVKDGAVESLRKASRSGVLPERMSAIPATFAGRWMCLSNRAVIHWRGASNNLRATIMTLVSILIFSVVLAMLKSVGARIPMTEILLIRQMVVTLVIMQLVRGNLRHALNTQRPGLQVLRGLFSFGSQITQFVAVLYIPLAEVTALSFSQVIFITIAAAIFLKETVSWRRWLATAIGLAGVIVMLLPAGGTVIDIFVVMALASGLLSAGVTITIRSMTHTESTITIMLYQCIILSMAYVGPALWWWVWPTAHEWVLLIALGTLGSVAQFLFTRACQIGEASALAPLEFSRLLLAAAVGYFVFLEVPSLMTVVGAVIIISSTVYTVRHNR